MCEQPHFLFCFIFQYTNYTFVYILFDVCSKTCHVFCSICTVSFRKKLVKVRQEERDFMQSSPKNFQPAYFSDPISHSVIFHSWDQTLLSGRDVEGGGEEGERMRHQKCIHFLQHTNNPGRRKKFREKSGDTSCCSVLHFSFVQRQKRKEYIMFALLTFTISFILSAL